MTPRRSEPMPVKYWSAAGLMLTYWCNARCASCHVRSGPQRGEWMDVEQGLTWWEQLISASPHGCRVHVTGGEPFGDWPRLISLCRGAHRAGLGPLQAVETNAFWATEERIVRDRLGALDAAGMGKLSISADPYHQQYVPIERCRLAARVGQEVLGADRVQVRWGRWLDAGCDTGELAAAQREDLFRRYVPRGRVRWAGRAVRLLAPAWLVKTVEELADMPCSEALLRSKHVHLDPSGLICPGTCVGIVLGHASAESIGGAWRRLAEDHADREVVGTLARCGPVGLLAAARRTGFVPAEAYAGKCHLCWELRTHLANRREAVGELGPGWVYRAGRGEDEKSGQLPASPQRRMQ